MSGTGFREYIEPSSKKASSAIEPTYVQTSLPLDPSQYEGDEYFCLFTPRIHRDSALADRGSWNCHVDFLEAAGAADAKRNEGHRSYAVGCINADVGNFTALCACESLPERLELITYMVEYAYIHDDVIEYAENKAQNMLEETNRAHFEGLTGESKSTTKENVRRRHLQAKMAAQLLDMDSKKGNEILTMWKEMSETFVNIRDLRWESLDDYLAFRAVDAGCPWTMGLLLFATDFTLTEEEERQTAAVTQAAFFAWCLVNDYFSFDKEWQNFDANGRKGEIVSSVYIFMQWYGVDGPEAKRRLRKEIRAREERYVEEKNKLIARGELTVRIANWFVMLDTVTAGNFAWSMTTARYNAHVYDPYPALRKAHAESRDMGLSEEAVTAAVKKPAEGSSSVDVAHAPAPAPALEPVLDTAPPADVHTDSERSSSPEDRSRSSGEGSPLTGATTVSEPAAVLTEEKVPVPYNKMVGPPLQSFNEIVLEPGAYVQSLPSKGVRNTVLDALEVWYGVPDASLVTIREIIDLLHSASLMLDDFQDNSDLRRGFPATHTVYGADRTINAANLMMVQAIKAAQSLSPAAGAIVLDKLVEGHLGQGADLYWTSQTIIPTIEEYFSMIDGKTGALFMLLAEVMRSEATINKDLDLSETSKLVGRFFQARDDYQNLSSAQYEDQKGFAEDISEGKLSLPMIHALRSPEHGRRLLSILQQRKRGDTLAPVVRKLALDEIRKAGGIDFAKEVIGDLQKAVWDSLGRVEAHCKTDNWILRLVLKKLEID